MLKLVLPDDLCFKCYLVLFQMFMLKLFLSVDFVSSVTFKFTHFKLALFQMLIFNLPLPVSIVSDFNV